MLTAYDEIFLHSKNKNTTVAGMAQYSAKFFQNNPLMGIKRCTIGGSDHIFRHLVFSMVVTTYFVIAVFTVDVVK